MAQKMLKENNINIFVTHAHRSVCYAVTYALPTLRSDDATAKKWGQMEEVCNVFTYLIVSQHFCIHIIAIASRAFVDCCGQSPNGFQFASSSNEYIIFSFLICISWSIIASKGNMCRFSRLKCVKLKNTYSATTRY